MDPHQKASVYDQLLDRIVNGPLQPGAVLRDTAIAEELGVSRTPVREALIRMSQEGFVDFHRGHKTIVSMIDYDRADRKSVV